MSIIKGCYYYHSVRINGRVTSRYLGMGELGRLLAEDYALIGRERELDRLEAREHHARLRRAYEAECRRGRIVRSLAGVYLEARGFVLWNRTQWRRRRMGAARALPAPQ